MRRHYKGCRAHSPGTERTVAVVILTLLLAGCVESGLAGKADAPSVHLSGPDYLQTFLEEQKKAGEQASSRFDTALDAAKRKRTGKVEASPVRHASSEPKALAGGAPAPADTRNAGGVTMNAPWKCVPSSLKSVIETVARNFGPVTVNSTLRSIAGNRRAGGAGNSYHLRCQAVDFRVQGTGSGVYAFLARHRSVGGLKRYRSGFFHIDTGPRRSW